MSGLGGLGCTDKQNPVSRFTILVGVDGIEKTDCFIRDLVEIADF
jgi:hypothetical protein